MNSPISYTIIINITMYMILRDSTNNANEQAMYMILRDEKVCLNVHQYYYG